MSRDWFVQMHVVHYASRYASMADAQDQEDGLAVLAFFFQVSTAAAPQYSVTTCRKRV